MYPPDPNPSPNSTPSVSPYRCVRGLQPKPNETQQMKHEMISKITLRNMTMTTTTTATHPPMTTDYPEVPVEDHRKKVCTKCGVLQFHSEFKWTKKSMRRVRCNTCTGIKMLTLPEPTPEADLKTPKAARDALALILSIELARAHAIQYDQHGNSTCLALVHIIPPRPLSPWHSIAGLPITTSSRAFKAHMLFHYADDYLLPRILRDYEASMANKASILRTRRAASKTRAHKGGRSCQQCEKAVDPTAHARRKFCSNACRQAHSRSNVTQSDRVPL